MSKIASMIPGLPQEMLQGSDEEGASRMKRMIYITDSMTSAELDSDGTLFMEVGKDGKPVGLTWRVTRVARGSGTSVREVEELLCQYRMMANMAKQAGGKNGWMQAMQKMQSAAGGRGRGAGGMPTPAQIQAMQVRHRSPLSVFSFDAANADTHFSPWIRLPGLACVSARCPRGWSSRCSARCAAAAASRR